MTESATGDFTIINMLGLHARAATKLVQTASRFPCNVEVSRDDQSANGKSVMGVLLLCGSRGTVVTVKATGPQAEACVQAIGALDRQPLWRGDLMESGSPPPPSVSDVSPAPSSEGSSPSGAVWKGIPGSPGVAVGPALVIGDTRAVYTRRHIHAAQIEAEIERVAGAVGAAKATLIEVSKRLQAGPAHDTTPILDAYLVMLSDPLLHESIDPDDSRGAKVRRVGRRQRRAKRSASSFSAQGSNDSDSYIVERRHDVEFVARSAPPRADGRAAASPSRVSTTPTIIVARDLSPADTAGMVKEPAIALVTEVGTRTSHTSIMARALEIPAVVGAAGALFHVRTGDIAHRGRSSRRGHSPPERSSRSREALRARRAPPGVRARASSRRAPAVRHCVTASAIALRGNVELPAEAILALDHGADGIGLYRTEFLYIDRATQPDEDEQYELYRAVIEAVSPRPVTLRTFDIGGDKFASTFQLPAEMNPALGSPRRPPRAEPAGGLPHPAPRDGPRERARRPAHHDPDGRERLRDPGGARSSSPARSARSRCAEPPARGEDPARDDGRGAVAPRSWPTSSRARPSFSASGRTTSSSTRSRSTARAGRSRASRRPSIPRSSA